MDTFKSQISTDEHGKQYAHFSGRDAVYTVAVEDFAAESEHITIKTHSDGVVDYYFSDDTGPLADEFTGI